MKSRSTTIWHEVLVLAIYFIFSSLVSFLFCKKLSGDAGIILLLSIFITGISAFASILIISQLKFKIKDAKLEFFYGLIPLALSVILHFIVIDADSKEGKTFLIINVVTVILLYSLSIRYKLNKRYH